MPDPYEEMNPAPIQPEADVPRPGGGSGWVAWVIGIVLVIVVGGGLYYYYQYIKIPELNKKIDGLQNQVDDLQKQLSAEVPKCPDYVNETYGYSVTCPDGWIASADTGTDPSESKRLSWIEFQSSEYQTTKGESGSAIAIEVLKDYSSITVYVNEAQNSDLGKNLFSVKDVTLGPDKIAAKQLSTEGEGGTLKTALYSDSKVYVIHLIGESKTNAEYDQMLSFFQFTP
jgi:hypothetical protein